ncbi:hypothetical protein ABID52_000614 [Fictibacillus halophilus]|uniref:Uncharacterized protein n=1 Tax=Fictibacillus halophilus TaxID=1610490 RepID=A0ABV2LEL2_9BACL|nr:hypothetical protein [Fictibacillus halophilus]
MKRDIRLFVQVSNILSIWIVLEKMMKMAIPKKRENRPFAFRSSRICIK